MASGDGLLVRVKPVGGALTLDQAEALSRLAARHGNGVIELTSRGNLQVRGLTDSSLQPMTEALDALSLLDATPESEAVRNIIASPLAGLDRGGADTRQVTIDLDRRLRAAPELSGLSDKFGFLIDGGGILPLHDVEADIRFVWNGGSFSIGLANEATVDWIGACLTDAVADTAISLAGQFLSNAGSARRMRDLPRDAKRAIAENLACHDGSLPASQLPPAARIAGCLERGPNDAPLVAAAVGLPFGGATADALGVAFASARRHGIAEVRLTPWRTLLFPVQDVEAARAVLAACAGAGLITEAGDARQAIAACPGAPACRNGTTPVRRDAEHLSVILGEALRSGLDLHVSGCTKGCARRQPAALTFVADAGRYGLVVNGTASDAPCGRFSVPQAAETLARLASAMTKADSENRSGQAAAIERALKEIQAA